MSVPPRTIDPNSIAKHFDQAEGQQRWHAFWQRLAVYDYDPSKSRDYRYDVRRAEATYLMGRAYLGLGGKENLETAELWLLRVPALYPGRGRVYTLSCRELARVYKDLGNNKRAAEWGRRGRADDGKLD